MKVPQDIDAARQYVDALEVRSVEGWYSKESPRHSEMSYRQLFEANPLPMWVYHVETLKFLAVNDAAVDHYGYSRDEFLTMSIADIHPEVGMLHASTAIVREGVRHSGIWQHRKRDGTSIHVEITSHQIDFSGQRARFVLANNITERTIQEIKIARLSRIRAVTSGISSAMLRLRDRDALLQEACRVAATEGVFPVAWIRAVDDQYAHRSILAEHGDPQAIHLVNKYNADPTWPDADRPTVRAARERRTIIANNLFLEPGMAPIRDEVTRCGYFSCAAFPLIVEDKVVAVVGLLATEFDFFNAEEVALLESVVADLSYALENIEKSQRLDYLASHDGLTGLPNIRLFGSLLEQLVSTARQEQKPVDIVVLDLVRFTQINDLVGRQGGDQLLSQLASRFREFVNEPHILCRITGDSFVAASRSDPGSIVSRLCERMFSALAQPFLVDTTEVRISAKAGIARFPADGEDGSTVLKNAEAALRLAKSSSSRSLYYSAETNERILERLGLEKDLRTAIEARQFVLHYQPRVDMTSGKIIGAEALIRWEHPRRGLVAPSEFMALAEETGLIVAIGTWALNEVCEQQAKWIAAGLLAVPIAVNISSLQLENEDLLELLHTTLMTHRLEARYIELELTESAVLKDAVVATKTLKALRKMGIGLALDDFGTGYSSLATLKRFPFHSVKIDKSFVTNITHDAEDAAIATAIIAMAHRLNLKVVAEGVETQGQFNYLRAQGCDEMQGNWFSPAVSKDVYAEQLASHKRLSFPVIANSGKQTLLLVDDEPGVRAALMRVLRQDGYHILTAAGGAEALDLLAINAVQVILSDQRMPGMSGTEFLDTVRQLYPDTVRMILSGYTDIETVTESVNRGAVFKFLTKPYDDNLLRQQVRNAFRAIQLEN